MKRLAALILGIAVGAAAGSAHGKVIKVVPGPGTPLQDAIDAASPRDVVRLAPGTYAEAIVIAKPLRIIGPGTVLPRFDSATIDAGCATPVALTIASDDVRVEKLAVLGGTFAAVDVQGGDRVKLRIGSAPSCDGVQYGVRATGTTRLRVERGMFRAFRTQFNEPSSCDSGATLERVFAVAALYVAGTPAGGNARVLSNQVCEAATGILLQDTADLPTGQPSATLMKNGLFFNDRGIALVNSDGAAIRVNKVVVAPPAVGVSGIELDAGSDDNVVVQNEIDGHVTDVSDLGTSNCWRRNEFTTGSVPSTGCP